MSIDVRASLRDLMVELGADVVVVDSERMDKYRWDRALDPDAGMPLAVVRAGSTEDVQAAVRFAAAHGVPVVPRGAGSGLSGGSSAVEGCIVVSTERMTRIEVDPVTRMAVVQPGAMNVQVKAAAAEHGLWYPHYSVSKAGLIHLARVLAAEWATVGIRVNCVAPTIVATEMTRAVRRDAIYLRDKLRTIPLGRMATVQDVASAVCYLSSPAAPWSRGIRCSLMEASRRVGGSLRDTAASTSVSPGRPQQSKSLDRGETSSTEGSERRASRKCPRPGLLGCHITADLCLVADPGKPDSRRMVASRLAPGVRSERI